MSSMRAPGVFAVIVMGLAAPCVTPSSILSSAAAQTPPGGYGSRVLPAVRLPATVARPVIDGDISDAAWKLAAHAATFIDSSNSQVAADQTDAYLMYDQSNIYVAFYCHDSQPGAIVARETVRDADLGNDDYVQFRIDPFMTFKGGDSSFFKVNAIGTQSTQLAGGRAGKIEWQGQWKAAARRVADGWTAEMQIPWSILSYPSAATTTMAFQLSRNQARTHVFSYWSDLTPSGFDERLGRWNGVSPPTQRWKPRLSFLPYLLPGLNFGGGRQSVRSGLDVRYQPTSDLTGVATYKPDFSNVEGAVAGIGFSRGERFVPERRPFFLDGGEYLQLGEGYEIGQFFDSVHIAQFDDGVKMYGQITPSTTMGVLATNEGRLSDPLGERNVVAQFRRNLGPTSGANLMLIQHQTFEENNSVIILAPNSRRGKWSVNGQAVATADAASGFSTSLGDGRGIGYTGALNFQDTNFFTTIRGLNVGDRFSDRLGLIFPTDYKGFSNFTDWSGQWRHGPWRDFDVSGGPTWDWHQNGVPFRRQYGIFGQVETRSDHRIGIGVSGGKFDNQMDLVYNLSLATGISNRFRNYNLNLSVGKQADKAYSSIGPGFSVRVFKKMDLVLNSFLQNYQGFGQQHVLTFNYELSATRSWGGRVVVDDSNTNWYLAYRNAGHAGTETYLIIGDPNAQRFTKQALLKIVFAL